MDPMVLLSDFLLAAVVLYFIVKWAVRAGTKPEDTTSKHTFPVVRREEYKPPPVEPILDLPGRFKVTGVDRQTKMDCVQFYEAAGPDNAKVKAELDGMVVTRVEPA